MSGNCNTNCNPDPQHRILQVKLWKLPESPSSLLDSTPGSNKEEKLSEETRKIRKTSNRKRPQGKLTKSDSLSTDSKNSKGVGLSNNGSIRNPGKKNRKGPQRNPKKSGSCQKAKLIVNEVLNQCKGSIGATLFPICPGPFLPNNFLSLTFVPEVEATWPIHGYGYDYEYDCMMNTNTFEIDEGPHSWWNDFGHRFRYGPSDNKLELANDPQLVDFTFGNKNLDIIMEEDEKTIRKVIPEKKNVLTSITNKTIIKQKPLKVNIQKAKENSPKPKENRYDENEDA